MTTLQVRDKFLKNKDSIAKAKELLKEQWFQDYIACVSTMMGEYRLNAQPSHFPHIQSEHVGGAKGISKFISKMKSLPFEELTNTSEDGDSEYVGFAEPSLK